MAAPLSAQANPSGSWVVTLYDFAGNAAQHQLGYQAGTPIQIVTPGDSATGWWSGKIRGQGAMGYFAGSYARTALPHEIPTTTAPAPVQRQGSQAGFQQISMLKRLEKIKSKSSGHDSDSDEETRAAEKKKKEEANFDRKECSMSLVTAREMELMDYTKFELEKTKKEVKEEDGILQKERTKAWKKVDIPLQQEQATKKLHDLIRKPGIPLFSRRKVWMSLTGAAEFKRDYSNAYETVSGEGRKKKVEKHAQALTKAFGGERVPTRFPPGSIPLFGGTTPKPVMEFLSGEGNESLQRVLVTLQHNNAKLEHAPMIPPIVALLLTHMPESDAYIVIDRMVKQSASDHWYFGLKKVHTEHLVGTFMDVVADRIPDVAKHLVKLRVDDHQFANFFFFPLFTRILPFFTVLRVFECYLSEGFTTLYAVGLAMLKIHAKQVLKCKQGAELGRALRDLGMATAGKEAQSLLKVAFGMVNRKEFIGFYQRRMKHVKEVEEEKARKEAEELKRLASMDHGVEMAKKAAVQKKDKRTVKVTLVLDTEMYFDPTATIQELLPQVCRSFKHSLKRPRFCNLVEPMEYPLAKGTPRKEVAPNASLLESKLEEAVMLVQTEEMPVEQDDEPDIWEEPADSVANIQFDVDMMDKVAAASLNKLIERITDPNLHDMNELKCFLLTYDTYVDAGRLLKKFMQRYDVPTSDTLSEEEWRKSVQFPIQMRTISAINQWLDLRFSIFDETLTKTLTDWLDNVVYRDGNKALTKKTRMTLAKKAKEKEQEGNRQYMFDKPPPPAKVEMKATRLKFDDIDEEEIARQITLVDFDLFKRIEAEELLGQAWAKPKLHHKCPNLLAMINRANDVSRWVSCQIVTCERLKVRARLMTKFVKIAGFLRELNNFNGVMAIVAGLNNSGILRLKRTRKELSRKTLDILNQVEELMNAKSSFKQYRTMLTSCSPPCIPYLGVVLSDLTFIDDGNPDTVGEKELVNFGKCRMLYDAFGNVMRYKQSPYNLQRVEQLELMVSAFPPPLDDKELFRLSLVREPRDPAAKVL